MNIKRNLAAILLLWSVATGVFSCQKRSDFVNEAQLGPGIHYLPQLLNSAYVDTLSGVPIGDSLLYPSQVLVFEVVFRSQDPLASLQLLGSVNGSSFQSIQQVPWTTSMYSQVLQADTAFLRYQVPDSLPASSRIALLVRLNTQSGLNTQVQLSCLTH